MWNPFHRKQPKKLALSLGSGGAKGMAHLGILKAFEEEGLTFDIITGTSIGAIIGGAYALGMTSDQLLEAVKTVDVSAIRKKGLLSQISMTDSANVERAVASVIGESTTFADTKVPFSAVAVDLVSGKEVVLSEGNLAKAVTASGAVAPVFTPVEYGDKHLIDGAYLNPIPADVARAMGADIVISVDLSTKDSATTDSTRMLDVLFTSVKIAMRNAKYKGYHNSNYVLHPDLTGFASTKFEGAEKMYQIGYETAKEHMPEIRGMLKMQGYRTKGVKNDDATKE